MHIKCTEKDTDVDVYGSAVNKFDDCQVVKPKIKYTLYIEVKSYGIAGISMAIDECVLELEECDGDRQSVSIDIKDFDVSVNKEPDDECSFYMRSASIDLDTKTVDVWL